MTKDVLRAIEVMKVINSVLKRGYDVKIRRKGNGFVILETKEKIKYIPPPIEAEEGQLKPIVE